MRKIIYLFFILILLSIGFACSEDTNDNKQNEVQIEYTVTFIIDGVKTEVKVKDGEKASKPTAPEKDGHVFKGWYLGEEEYHFGEVNSNIEVVAKFEKVKEYTVKFIVDAAEETVVIKEGEKAKKPVDPVKDGYEFLGWFLGDAEYDFENAVTNDLEITAKFEEIIKEPVNVKVIFNEDRVIEFKNNYNEKLNYEFIYSYLFNLNSEYKLYNFDLYLNSEEEVYNNELLNNDVIFNFKLKPLTFEESALIKYYEQIKCNYLINFDYESFKSKFDFESELVTINDMFNFRLIDNKENIIINYHIFDDNMEVTMKSAFFEMTEMAIIEFDSFNGACALFNNFAIVKKNSYYDFSDYSSLTPHKKWFDMYSYSYYTDHVDNVTSSLYLVPYNDYGIYYSRVTNYFNENTNFEFELNNRYYLTDLLNYNPKKINDEKYIITVDNVNYTFTLANKYNKTLFYVSKVSTNKSIFNKTFEETYDILIKLFNAYDDKVLENEKIKISYSENEFTMELEYIDLVG